MICITQHFLASPSATLHKNLLCLLFPGNLDIAEHKVPELLMDLAQHYTDELLEMK